MKSKIFIVREHIPLEQGLRRSTLYLSVLLVLVREHIPLEQGLRPIKNLINCPLEKESESIFH